MGCWWVSFSAVLCCTAVPWCDGVMLALVPLLLQQQYFPSYDIEPHVRIYMPHSSAVVVLTRVYVASPLVILYHSAAYGSFDDRRLPPSNVAPCILFVAVGSCERRAKVKPHAT